MCSRVLESSLFRARWRLKLANRSPNAPKYRHKQNKENHNFALILAMVRKPQRKAIIGITPQEMAQSKENGHRNGSRNKQCKINRTHNLKAHPLNGISTH